MRPDGVSVRLRPGAEVAEARPVAVSRIDADLAAGRHAGLVGELEALVARNPLRERVRDMLSAAEADAWRANLAPRDGGSARSEVLAVRAGRGRGGADS